MRLHRLTLHLLALGLGAAAVAAWAPLACWPLAPLTYSALFLLIGTKAKPLAAAALGQLFGLGLHLTGHGWVYTTMVGPAGLDSVSATMASAIVVLGLSLFTALPCALHAKLIARFSGSAVPHWVHAASFASLLTAGEMVRVMVFDRFSSLSLGYALLDTWFAGWAPVLGAYGLSWIGYCSAAAFALLLTTSRTQMARRLTVVIPVVLFGLAGFVMQQMRWTEATGSPLHFRLVQPNTKQATKFDPALRAGISQQVVTLLTEEPADLVVAPETAFPLYWNELPDGTASMLQDFATHTGSHLIFGIATVGSQAEGHNSMLHMEPGGTGVTRYDKIHLFPFGEYAPKWLAWITQNLAIPMQDLSAGASEQTPFLLAQGNSTFYIGTLICNESMLSDEARRLAPRVGILINPGNMAWFDGTLAIDQGLQITRMRALEVSRPILRVSSTGTTASILATGVVSQVLPVGQTASMVGTIMGRTGLTPYARFGDWPVWALCLLSLAAALVAGNANRPRWRQSRETAPRCSQTG